MPTSPEGRGGAGALILAAALVFLAAARAPIHPGPGPGGPAARDGYVDGAPPGYTGGFGEPTCLVCHSDGALNEPGGLLTLDGVTARYRPGSRYLLVITLTQDGMRSGGFQLAARWTEGPLAGRSAGVLEPLDGRTQIRASADSAVFYAGHTMAGTELVSAGHAQWLVRWAAPAGKGTVIFHVTANGSNDDASPLGDHIYATRRLSRAD